MSTWTMDEVQELTMQCGGGNHAALQTWLLHAPHVGERFIENQLYMKDSDVNLDNV